MNDFTFSQKSRQIKQFWNYKIFPNQTILKAWNLPKSIIFTPWFCKKKKTIIQKSTQATLFDSFYKTNFAAFLHRKVKVAQIWSAHQSKALIFYFGMRKILSWNFENFVGNRQSGFHKFKFSVCLHTLWILKYEI